MEKFLFLARRCRRLYLICAIISAGILFIIYHKNENISRIYSSHAQNEETVPTIDSKILKIRNGAFEASSISKTSLEFREKPKAQTYLTDLFRTSRNAVFSTRNVATSSTNNITTSAGNIVNSSTNSIALSSTRNVAISFVNNITTSADNILDSSTNNIASSSTNKIVISSTNSIIEYTSNSSEAHYHKIDHNKTKYSASITNSSLFISTYKYIEGIATKSTTSMPIPETCNKYSMKDSQLILLWTPFFGGWDYFPQGNFQLCSHCRNCRITTDRSKLRESDGVIFHCRDISLFDLPPVRHPHQRWIFYCLESPPYSDFPGLQYMKNMFNWTMTYRTDSDIVVRYGAIVKDQQPKQIDLNTLKRYFSKKSKSVVWMTSHCPTFGGRDEYVAELRKYIDVDVYGTCGSSICPPGGTEKCLQEYADKYKFFLAFENTICKDYITEKLFRNLKYDIIPVVFGGADYDKFVPPNSYIDALSFQSPKHLALYLTEVGKDFKFYAEYFKWRENYSIGIINRKECDLCTMLHRKHQRISSYGDLRQWWVTDSQCHSWEPK